MMQHTSNITQNFQSLFFLLGGGGLKQTIIANITISNAKASLGCLGVPQLQNHLVCECAVLLCGDWTANVRCSA
jgi:hypothetical protein